MKKLRTVLVDDEPLALRLLEHELAGLESVEIVAICKNGKEALTAISDHEPDMVFLDVQMPGLNGFDVVKNLQSDTMPMIVFVTAYDQFALAAFEIHAVDYLLKPLDSSRLARAVDRAVERLCSSASVVTSDETKSQLISVISSISDKVNQLNGDPHLLDSSVGLANSVRRIPIKDGDTITDIDEKYFIKFWLLTFIFIFSSLVIFEDGEIARHRYPFDYLCFLIFLKKVKDYMATKKITLYS